MLKNIKYSILIALAVVIALPFCLFIAQNGKPVYNENLDIDSARPNENLQQDNKNLSNKESFPSVSLSVKNPFSSKVLIGMIALQIISNIGILYFLYIGME